MVTKYAFLKIRILSYICEIGRSIERALSAIFVNKPELVSTGFLAFEGKEVVSVADHLAL